ncbi:metaxin 2 [Loa loa]|uniref:Metaxin 2 n=1 Tax=Loa loa TaxID=7209 RepID=A0A1I7V8X6_LOALO|nr:metaxin 2 [Loa loa]EFO23963.1 metaxin 2 [Loa loa]
MTGSYFMTDLVADSLSSEVDVDWNDAVLYTPYHTQALLYEYADCLAVRTLLRMAKLPIRLEERPNAEFMSPTGKVPFLKLQSFLIPEFLPVVDFLAKRNVKLSAGLTDLERGDMHAHMALFDDILKNVEIHMMWMDKRNYSQVTKYRYGSVYLFPLNIILPRTKRREVSNYLTALDWKSKSQECIMELADRCFKSLSSKLDHNEYFFGDSPTELDALAFGHFYTILTTELPNMELKNYLRRYSNLTEFCQRIDKKYFVLETKK